MYDRIQIPTLSLADFCRRFCRLTESEIIEHDENFFTFASPGFLYSRNFILKATESELEEKLRTVREGLSKGLPAGVTFTEEGLPENYAEIFERSGFEPFIRQTGMIFDLDKGFREESDEHIRLMEDDEITGWSAVVAEGFPKPREDLPFTTLNKSEDVLTYGYMLDDKIASTGMLLIDPELSGIHEISTLPPYRGKGQGTAVILRMLQDLKNRGIRSVSLQASDAGKRIYEPIGFETVSMIPTWLPKK